MTVVVNGAPRDLAEDATVADIVAIITAAPGGRGVAVARNGDIILRSAWTTTHLVEGDRVEVLHAVQGG